MNKHLAKDLERYADMLAEGELVSPDDLNCSAVMRLAAEALAQPEQEPVAWAMFYNGYFIDAIDPDEHARIEGDYKHALYTTPPQRKPLTDEQIVAIYGNDMMNYRDGDYMRFARAIEAAHGIKEKNT